jgi:hypothetical protein
MHCARYVLHTERSEIGVDVQAELKSELWNPGVAPQSRILPQAQDEKSVNRKVKALKSTQDIRLPTMTQAPQHLSPVSNSPETSEPPTPPSMLSPTPKRAKTYSLHSGSNIPTTSCKYPFSFLLFYFKRTMVLD